MGDNVKDSLSTIDTRSKAVRDEIRNIKRKIEQVHESFSDDPLENPTSDIQSEPRTQIVEAVREVIGELKGQIDDTLYNEGQLFEERLRGLETQQRTMSNAAREACRTLQELRTMTNDVVSVLDEHVGSHQRQVMKE